MELEIDIGEMDGSIFEEEIAELEKELTTETDEEKTEPEPVREESVTETDPKSEKIEIPPGFDQTLLEPKFLPGLKTDPKTIIKNEKLEELDSLFLDFVEDISNMETQQITQKL